MKHDLDDYCFWVTPTFRRTGGPVNELDGWRVDVHLKRQVDEDEAITEPLETGRGDSPETALTDAVAKALAHDYRDPDAIGEDDEDDDPDGGEG